MKAPEAELVALAEAGHRRESLLRMASLLAVLPEIVIDEHPTGRNAVQGASTGRLLCG